jgi:hypothetical protein
MVNVATRNLRLPFGPMFLFVEPIIGSGSGLAS